MAARHTLQQLLVLVTAVLVSASAWSDNRTEFDDYVIYHSAIPSTFISPEIAEEYNLTRSRTIGILNVSIHARDGENDDKFKAVAASLDGSMTNEAQQRDSLSFKRVREGDAVYYLAQFQYRDGNSLDFELDVTPQGESDPLALRFSREIHDE